MTFEMLPYFVFYKQVKRIVRYNIPPLISSVGFASFISHILLLQCIFNGRRYNLDYGCCPSARSALYSKENNLYYRKLIIHHGLSSIQNNGFYYSDSLCDHHFIHKINLCWWASTCYQWSCCSTPIHYYYHYDTINMDLSHKINVV